MSDLYEFTVEWPSTSAQSVTVTGDFDQWSQSLHLSRSPSNGIFTATIKVPYGCPTRYKFIVDGEWLVRQDSPTEHSPEGFLNNVHYVPVKEPLEVLPTEVTSENEKAQTETAGQLISYLADTIAARDGTSGALEYVTSGMGKTIQTVVGVDPINSRQVYSLHFHSVYHHQKFTNRRLLDRDTHTDHTPVPRRFPVSRTRWRTCRYHRFHSCSRCRKPRVRRYFSLCPYHKRSKLTLLFLNLYQQLPLPLPPPWRPTSL
ncbi:carbohydrate-binding module family 48 protein [Macrolepiota fuliginosa MF-IS2]|uniref:Carbohydrate-binding module family 48 protein n=1 Tax=Macrolepiota fuliginosa MF-IS2 TaxID=1400762 RepID=A0A9P5XKM2_9AGAR|nr:carbohydrate-binding module family 48 protein [Macrolepiota fuliginosa MF-IS2]